MLKGIIVVMLLLSLQGILLFITISNTRKISKINERLRDEDSSLSNRISSMLSGINYNDEKLDLATNILATDIDVISSQIQDIEDTSQENKEEIEIIKNQIENTTA